MNHEKKFRSQSIPYFILILVSSLLLLFFLWWRYRLGMSRYFDADEFVHMHWTAQMLLGHRPYSDFLTFFPPGFWFFLMPAFIGGWCTVGPFIFARFLVYLLFLLTALGSGLVFWEMRRSFLGSIWVLVFLSFLPMPLDKFLEIRPDNLSTMLVVWGLYFQLRWVLRTSRSGAFVSGILYGMAVFTLTKVVPVVAVNSLFAFFWYRSKYPDWFRLRSGLMVFLSGIVLWLVILMFYGLSAGDFSRFWYSIVAMPVEANKISRFFIMMPNLFFYPNSIYYGADGWNTGLVVNHALWMLGIFFGCFRLLVPTSVPEKGNPREVNADRAWAEVLVGVQLALNIIIFVLFIPLKHAQYLIPISPFIAVYLADFFGSLYRKSNRSYRGLYAGVMLFFLGFMAQTFIQVNKPKLQWNNTDELDKLQNLYQKIPQNEMVLDLDGKLIFNPDAYYACCIPFGQFSRFLTRPLPDLKNVLELNRVKYINQGGLNRVNDLDPKAVDYIRSVYRPSEIDSSILIRLK